jgi:hypothetical protein
LVLHEEPLGFEKLIPALANCFNLLRGLNVDNAYCMHQFKDWKQSESILFFSKLSDVGKSTDLCECFKDSPACPSGISSSINVEMSMDSLWNDTGRGKPKHSLKNLG